MQLLGIRARKNVQLEAIHSPAKLFYLLPQLYKRLCLQPQKVLIKIRSFKFVQSALPLGKRQYLKVMHAQTMIMHLVIVCNFKFLAGFIKPEPDAERTERRHIEIRRMFALKRMIFVHLSSRHMKSLLHTEIFHFFSQVLDSPRSQSKEVFNLRGQNTIKLSKHFFFLQTFGTQFPHLIISHE